MHKEISRRALYELVWTRPRTDLAKQFNISDVAVGKLCRQLNVPAPPPGYWAHIAANGAGKAKYTKPPLTYTVAERIDEDHEAIRAAAPDVDPEDLEQPLPPPTECQETLADTLQRYRQIIGTVGVPKPSSPQHPIVEKLVKEDERLASLATRYSWEQPKYQGPQGKHLLSLLSRLLWWWTELGFRPSSSGTRHIQLYVSLGTYQLPFKLSASSADEGAGKARAPSAFELSFESERRPSTGKKKPPLTFTSLDQDTFMSVALQMVEMRENNFREWLKWSHDHLKWKRKDALDKDRAATEAERSRREAENLALLASRDLAFNEALAGIERAVRIRDLVAILSDKLGNEEHRASFARWRLWALAQADALDIRTRSAQELAGWVQRFQLSPDDAI